MLLYKYKKQILGGGPGLSENIKIGDYIIYDDGRDKYAGTVISINEANKKAKIKVIITIKEEQKFAEMDVPVSKLKPRSLV